MVITDCFQLKSLTECFPLHTNVYENVMATWQACAFGTFKIAIEKLHNHYQNLVSRSMHELQTHERTLRVTFLYPDSYETKLERVKFTCNYCFIAEKPVFVATTTKSTKVLVKFTRWYSEDAHQFCIEAG